MASILDRFKTLITKQAQNTNINYNKALYNWLGNSIIWNSENDDTYIREGYQRNATVYSIINLITKAASTIPLQIYEVSNEANAKRYKSMTSGYMDSNAMHAANVLRKRAFKEVDNTALHKLL
jgi:phage portal protein BeeE